jgi:hypothetical protein
MLHLGPFDALMLREIDFGRRRVVSEGVSTTKPAVVVLEKVSSNLHVR